jgi:hypothetical protein
MRSAAKPCTSRAHVLRLQAGRQDQLPGGDGAGIVTANAHLNLAGRRRGAQERRVEHHRTTVRLDLADQRVHEAMRVEHAALGRVQRRHASQGRLHGQRLSAVQACDALDLVGLAARRQRRQGRQFAVLRRHDELAALVEGDPVAFEERRTATAGPEHTGAPSATPVRSAGQRG